MKYITKIAKFALSDLPMPIKNIIREVLPKSIKRIIGRIVMADAVKKNGVVTSHDGRIFKVIEDRLFLRVFFEKDYEPLLSEIARRLLEQGDSVIDIGANFGWYSTLFNKQVLPGGKVISYEPSPRSLEILTNNIRLNDMESSIEVRASCVGASTGTILLEPGSISESGLAHVVDKNTQSTIESSIVTLDNDLKDIIGKIAYIKIDIEGYELSALKGASKILGAPNKPIIQIELFDEALERNGASRQKAVDYLKSFGYTFWEAVPKHPGTLKETDADQGCNIFCFGPGIYGDRIKVTRKK